jgi:ribonuclease HIII
LLALSEPGGPELLLAVRLGASIVFQQVVNLVCAVALKPPDNLLASSETGTPIASVDGSAQSVIGIDHVGHTDSHGPLLSPADSCRTGNVTVSP